MPDEWLDDQSGVLDGLIGQRWQDVLLVRRLGSGGVGAIYLALQLPLMMKVAVKFLTDGAPKALASRLRDEALALSRLHHHHIVRLLKYGEIGQRTFLVMEFVDGGRTLADAMERGELDRPARIRVLRQLIEALEAAHALDVVHRDVKPENIMLQAAPREPHFVKLVDFGLAKFTDGGRESTQLAAGTPTYMAPEQITRRNIGPWTDWYAVAMIALELLLDHRPYAHMSTDEVVRVKMSAVCDPTKGLAERALPPNVSRFFHLALATDPHNRLRTAPVFRDAFNAMVASLPPPEPVLEPTMAGRDLPELRALLARMPDPEDRPLGRGDSGERQPVFREAYTVREREPEPTREHPSRLEPATRPGGDSGPLDDLDGSLDDDDLTTESIAVPGQGMGRRPARFDDGRSLEPESPTGPLSDPRLPALAADDVDPATGRERGPTVHIETRVSEASPEGETRPRAVAPRAPMHRRFTPEPPPTLLSSAGRLPPRPPATPAAPPPGPPAAPPPRRPSPVARPPSGPTSGEAQQPRMTLTDPAGQRGPVVIPPQDIRQTRLDSKPLRVPPAPPKRPRETNRLPQRLPPRPPPPVADPPSRRAGTQLVAQPQSSGWRTLLLVMLLIGLGVLAAVIWLLLNPALPSASA